MQSRSRIGCTERLCLSKLKYLETPLKQNRRTVTDGDQVIQTYFIFLLHCCLVKNVRCAARSLKGSCSQYSAFVCWLVPVLFQGS